MASGRKKRYEKPVLRTAPPDYRMTRFYCPDRAREIAGLHYALFGRLPEEGFGEEEASGGLRAEQQREAGRSADD